jgi:hypothetical protein
MKFQDKMKFQNLKVRLKGERSIGRLVERGNLA